jgi:hypothetical protein
MFRWRLRGQVPLGGFGYFGALGALFLHGPDRRFLFAKRGAVSR